MNIFVLDFTGGICERVQLKDYKTKNSKTNVANNANVNKPIDELFYSIKKSFERRALMACAIEVSHSTVLCNLVFFFTENNL